MASGASSATRGRRETTPHPPQPLVGQPISHTSGERDLGMRFSPLSPEGRRGALKGLSMNEQPVIQAENLCIEYRLGKRWLNALRDISLTIYPREIHGLVGESGSGKTTLALALMRYFSGNARIVSGKILFDGED